MLFGSYNNRFSSQREKPFFILIARGKYPKTQHKKKIVEKNWRENAFCLFQYII
jgi:hypothetical protein